MHHDHFGITTIAAELGDKIIGQAMDWPDSERTLVQSVAAKGHASLAAVASEFTIDRAWETRVIEID